MSSKSSELNWNLIVAEAGDVNSAVASLSGHMDAEQRKKFEEKLNRYVRKPDRDLILAVSGKMVLGFYTVIDQDDLPDTISDATREHLIGFACGTGFMVRSDYRRRGVGESLQQRVEQWAKERGKPGFWLSTRRQAEWYRKHFGYEEVGRVVVKGIERTIMAKTFARQLIPGNERRHS